MEDAGGDALVQKKASHGVAKPEPAAVVRHRKTGRVLVKEEASEAVVKEEAAATVVKKESTAPVEPAGFALCSQDDASTGNNVKRERRRAGGARGLGTSSPQTMERDKKIGKKSPREADRKVKVKPEKKRRGGENISPKKISPRLAEKAALIINVMDALYPDPPIPINHVVRGERRDDRVAPRGGVLWVSFRMPSCVTVVSSIPKLVSSSFCSWASCAARVFLVCRRVWSAAKSYTLRVANYTYSSLDNYVVS